jgi:hypothetical protein
MLRGDIHLQILFGLRQRPDVTEIQARVTSAVDLILNGALRSEAVNSLEHEQRLAFLHDVRGELRGVAAADILDGVNGTGRNEQHVAGVE